MKSMRSHTFIKGRRQMTPKLSRNAGFTLIEMMIAIAIFGVVVAGVIGAFYDQLRSHNTQQALLEMQQNARAAMYYITRELRMAGYDPTGDANAGITPDAVNRDTITFSSDITGGEADGEDNDDDGVTDGADAVDEARYGDGATDDAEEVITYALNGDRIMRTAVDATGTVVNQTLAANIEALDFIYHGVEPGDPTNTTFRLIPAVAAANPNNIRFVNVTIIARTAVVPVVGYTVQDNTIYYNMTMDGNILINKQLAPDNFRRIMLQKRINLRNMGLN